MSRYLSLFLVFVACSAVAQTSVRLTGEPMGAVPFYDYSDRTESYSVNSYINAFDDDLTTYYASYATAHTYCGLDLGEPHIITQIAYAPRATTAAARGMRLGLIEGSNRADFLDAVPLYIIDEVPTINELTYQDIDVSKGFRYIRYYGSNGSRCQIAELQLFGYPAEGDSTHLYSLTNLPTVIVTTESGNDPVNKTTQLPAYLTLISDKGQTFIADSGTVRLRGNASMGFPKKPYRIKFAHKTRVLGSPAKAKKWCLINNYGDKTLIRNMIAFRMSEALNMPYTPFCRLVDVIVNNEYKGTYQLTDQVQAHKNRVPVEEMSTQDNEGEALTGDYFIEVDAYAAKEPCYFRSVNDTRVTVKSPEADSITTNQLNYIKTTYSAMENDPLQYVDLPTYLRHFLIGEATANTDTYWSVFMYKKRNDPLFYVGPVWDFDLAFGNDIRTAPVNEKDDFVALLGGSYEGYMRTMLQEILDDEYAWRLAQQIWYDARQSTFTEDALFEYIDDLADEIEQSERLNFMRWPILNTRVHQNPVARGSYEAEVAYLKEFLAERLQWMDRKLAIDDINTSLYIQLIDLETNKPCDIYSVTGQHISTIPKEQIHSLPQGVYLIRQNTKVCKIIIGN